MNCQGLASIVGELPTKKKAPPGEELPTKAKAEEIRLEVESILVQWANGGQKENLDDLARKIVEWIFKRL
jgi:hypothetical protein